MKVKKKKTAMIDCKKKGNNLVLPSSGVSTSQKFEEFPRFFRGKKTRPFYFSERKGYLEFFFSEANSFSGNRKSLEE